MNPAINALLGGLFLALGATALVLMLRIYGSAKPPASAPKLMGIHRTVGRAFAILYLGMVAIMIAKALDYDSFNAIQSLHIGLAIALLPLLGIKILIVRRYPKLHSMLPAMGISIFVVTVVMVALGAGPFLLDKVRASYAVALPEGELVAQGERLVRQRCQKCHDLDRVYKHKGRKSKELWEATLDRMISRDPSLADVRRPILAYVQAELAVPEGPRGEMLAGAALVEARCGKCHGLDRVFGPTKTKEGWRATVRRYAALLPDHIRLEEVEPIAAFLYAKRGAPTDPLEHKRKVFEQYCSKCHNLSRALDYARSAPLSSRHWGRTIRRMKRTAEERNVAAWSDEEAKVIAEYLAAQYPEEEVSEEDD